MWIPCVRNQETTHIFDNGVPPTGPPFGLCGVVEDRQRDVIGGTT